MFALEPGLARNRRHLLLLTTTSIAAEGEADAELARKASRG